jgi:hypothetical protein
MVGIAKGWVKFADNVKAFFNWCVDDSYIVNSPATKITLAAKFAAAIRVPLRCGDARPRFGISDY